MAKGEATLLIKIKEMASDSISKIGDGLKSLGQVALAAGTAIAGFAALAIKNFREQEEATNKLNQAMVNSGNFTSQLRDKYLDLAGAMQELSTFGDEQVIDAIAIIQGQTKMKEVSEELVQATMDLAAAKKMDLASAAEMVGKSIGTETNALARSGIALNQNMTESQKAAAVIEQLSSKYEGQALAATNGLGAIEQLKNTFSDLMETVGEKIAPTVVAMTNIFTALFNRMQEGDGFVETFASMFDFLARAVLWAKAGISELGGVIGIVLAGSIEAIKAAMTGNFSQAKMIVSDGLGEIKRMHTENAAQLNAELKMLDDARKQDVKMKHDEELQMTQAAAENKAKVDQDKHANDMIKLEQQFYEKQQMEANLIGADQQQKLQAQLAFLDKQIGQETDAKNKLHLMNQRAAVMSLMLEEKLAQDKLQNQKDTFSTIASLSNSNNSALAAIGKAAGITQVAIDTPVAVSKALAAFPPPFNFVAAGLVGAAMAAQAARIAGVQLADGGIVKARPGGIQATIGEGGQDEAVIPLGSEEARSRLGGGGTNITIIVNGGLLGDESSARELAQALDREFLKLRQNNASLAFDSGVV